MNRGGKTENSGGTPACTATTPWLFDFACRTGELDPAREDLVRKHLATCPECSKAAADLSAVVKLLHATPAHETKLDPARRTRILASLHKPRD